jgi:hypothetical protein
MKRPSLARCRAHGPYSVLGVRLDAVLIPNVIARMERAGSRGSKFFKRLGKV